MTPIALVAVLTFAQSGSDYPKVVRENGRVCVQTLSPGGEVEESCRPEGGETSYAVEGSGATRGAELRAIDHDIAELQERRVSVKWFAGTGVLLGAGTVIALVGVFAFLGNLDYDLRGCHLTFFGCSPHVPGGNPQAARVGVNVALAGLATLALSGIWAIGVAIARRGSVARQIEALELRRQQVEMQKVESRLPAAPVIAGYAWTF